jgi:hypothetical protein
LLSCINLNTVTWKLFKKKRKNICHHHTKEVKKVRFLTLGVASGRKLNLVDTLDGQKEQMFNIYFLK